MATYNDHWLSLVKFCNDFATGAASTLSIPAPVFVNLDAHANFSTVPSTDFIGLVHYAWHQTGKIIEVSTGLALSTYNDPDNVRHTQIMSLLVERVQPEKIIKIYSAASDGSISPTGWMSVQANLSVDPMARDTTRSLQIVTLHLVSGASGSL